MGSYEERFDVKGCNLARKRAVGMAIWYLRTRSDSIGAGGNIEKYGETQKTEFPIYKRLDKILNFLLPQDFFYMKESGPADDLEFVKKYGKLAAELYEANEFIGTESRTLGLHDVGG
ncbi:hypothetical protein HYZ41_01510 [archaeon]|nr:hypothetical protein [archaeon]